MLVSVEASGALERRMRVQVPAQDIDQKVAERLKQVGRRAKIEGFRPGKVPAKVIAKRYGAQVRQEVISEVMQSSYSQALQRESLVPAGSPSIEPEVAADDGDFAYTAVFEVFPEIQIEGLDRIAVSLPEVEIGDADIDRVIESLRVQRSDWVVVERAATAGDQVTVDFVGTLNGEAIENGTGTGVAVELGAGQMLDDFDAALHGMSAGEKKAFDVGYPADYPVPELAGQTGQFEATVGEVRERSLPELDAEFVTAFGIEDGEVETLRTEVRRNMEGELETKRAADIKQQVLEQLVESNPIEVPHALVQQEAGSMQQEAMRRMGIEDPAAAPPESEFLAGARRRVQVSLLVQEFIRSEGIEVDRQRLPAKLATLFSGYDANDEAMAQYLNDPRFLQQVEPMVLEDQAIEALRAKGTETARTVSFQDYMDAR